MGGAAEGGPAAFAFEVGAAPPFVGVVGICKRAGGVRRAHGVDTPRARPDVVFDALADTPAPTARDAVVVAVGPGVGNRRAGGGAGCCAVMIRALLDGFLGFGAAAGEFLRHPCLCGGGGEGAAVGALGGESVRAGG